MDKSIDMGKRGSVAVPHPQLRAFALATAVLFVLAWALSPRPTLADAKLAATVQFSFGAVTLVKPDGNRLSLSRGDSLHEGDTLLTGEDGRVHLRFNDGGFVSLIPHSEFRIDAWHFSGELDGNERLGMRLLKGGLRTISGRIGKMSRAAYELATRAATIGIRGTEYTVLYLPDGSVNGTVAEGQIAVCNQGGCLDVSASYSFLVTSPNSQPVLTDRAAELSVPPTRTKAKAADAGEAKQKTANGSDLPRGTKPEAVPESEAAGKTQFKVDKSDKQKSLADAAAIIGPAQPVNLIDYDMQPVEPAYSQTPTADPLSARVPDLGNSADFSGSGLSVKGGKPNKK